MRHIRRAFLLASHVAAAGVLVALALALGVNVVSRSLGAPVVGANLLAAWLLPVLAFVALCRMLPAGPGLREDGARLVSGFALAALGLGMASAAMRIGGTEPVLAIPVALRFWVGAVAAAAALVTGALLGVRAAVALLAGAALALLPLPALPAGLAAAAFALFLWLRAPVALALVAAVALAPGPLSDAAMAQSVMRGLSGYVLLAVPLFILAAGLMVAGGIGDDIVTALRRVTRGRPTALGEANVWASLLFGGVSGSSIADAATGARLLAPGMVRAGYTPARAAAICAASAILPNVMPPSIALLIAAAATDLSVGALWFAGALAAPVLAIALFIAVRLTPPREPVVAAEGEGAAEADGVLVRLVPAVAIAVAILGGLRLGIVTAVEAGLLAVAIAAVFALRRAGMRPLLDAVLEAADQSGRVVLLIAAAAPVAFLIATSGLDVAAVLPAGPPALILAAAVALCLLAGTVLDAGAAILLMLPFLVPAVAAGGVEPVHAALTLSIALVLGGLTPPVGILILVVKEVTGAHGVYRAVVPYVLALAMALLAITVAPILWDALHTVLSN